MDSSLTHRAVDGAAYPLIIAHRGASADAPENTIAAFRRAMEDGADGVEFDVRVARDGVPVVIHDSTLRRTGTRKDAVSALTSEQLINEEVGSWFNVAFPERVRTEYTHECVPTLEQTLQCFREGSSELYVELKSGRRDSRQSIVQLAYEVVERVRAKDLVSRVVIEAFSLGAIEEVKRIAPEIRTAALFDRTLKRPFPSVRFLVGEALACGADQIALHHSLARRPTIERAKDACLDVVVWTVDDPQWAGRARALGVHALITNRPFQMRAALNRF